MALFFLTHVISLTFLAVECKASESSKIRPRRFILSPVDSTKELRFVAFGTSVTYGSGIPDRETQAYIKLLSSDGVNLAMRASDPSYPSICTQSMIGDSKYDVIVVEYERRYSTGLEHLVKRLRDRFPDALIVVTDVWTYMNVSVFDKDGNRMESFRNWLRNNGYEKNDHDLEQFVANAKDVTFRFDEHRLAPRKEYMQNLVDKYDVVLYTWAMKGPIDSIIKRHLPLYADDFVHFSKQGHKFVALGIEKIIKIRKVARSDKVGTWGEGDVCNSWLGSGEITGNFTSTGVMEQFDNRYGGKYALNFHKMGYVEINNPFDNERELAITYMTTGPAPSIYPKTEIRFFRSKQKPVIIDPTDNYYDYPVHVQSTQVVGLVTPGLNRLRILPLEKGKTSFRLVGFSITNESGNVSRMYMKPLTLGEEEEEEES